MICQECNQNWEYNPKVHIGWGFSNCATYGYCPLCYTEYQELIDQKKVPWKPGYLQPIAEPTGLVEFLSDQYSSQKSR